MKLFLTFFLRLQDDYIVGEKVRLVFAHVQDLQVGHLRAKRHTQ